MIIITRKITNIIFTFSLIIIFILFLTNVKYISSSIYSSLFFCAKRVIPTLFPFMFLCEILSRNLSIPNRFNKFFFKIANKLGICQKHIKAIFLGCICGFVNGPKLITQTDSPASLNSEEITSSVFLSSNASISFVVGIVGGFIWNSLTFGIFLYLTQIISSIIINKIYFDKKQSILIFNKEKTTSFFNSISNSIYSSTQTMIIICSYTIIFSLIIDLLSLYLASHLNSEIFSFIASSMEFTKGVYIATQHKNIQYSAFLTGFSVGFGGLCVAGQTFSVCEGFKLKKSLYIALKAIQGVICGLASIIFVTIYNLECTKEKLVFTEINSNYIFNSIIISIFLFFSLKLLKIFIKSHFFQKHY